MPYVCYYNVIALLINQERSQSTVYLCGISITPILNIESLEEPSLVCASSRNTSIA